MIITCGRSCSRIAAVLAAVLLAGLNACSLFAQTDSLAVFDHEAIVITADRIEGRLARSTAGISILRPETASRLPGTYLTDYLGTMPGISFLNRDGEGAEPMATVRGFYGGGEVDYVVVLVDGVLVNQVETGLVNWNALTGLNVESVEFLRGGASSLYGDAAIGGVMNIRTSTGPGSSGTAGILAGSNQFARINAAVRTDLNGRSAGIQVDYVRTNGFRDHGKRAVINLNGDIGLLTGRATLRLRSQNNWRDTDEPGYISGEQVAVDPAASSAYFLFDSRDEQTHSVILDGKWTASSSNTLIYSGGGDYRKSERISTLLLSTFFADTKLRVLDTRRLFGSSQFVHTIDLPGFTGHIRAGGDVAHASLNSVYYNYFRGGLEDYEGGSLPEDLSLDESGEGNRTTLAGFIQFDGSPSEKLTISLGGRIDHLSDTFDPIGESVVPASDAVHTVFSPRAGVNFRYLAEDQPGSFYVNVGRSFKAPTLDQKYDQRTIPVPFEPFKITLSNGGLKPQTAIHYEVGLYQRIRLPMDRAAAEISASIYQIDLEDEIDFDLQQFRYVNIGESRHRGIEVGLKVFMIPATVSISYGLQDATQTGGDFDGFNLKAVPRHIYSLGLQGDVVEEFALGATVTGATGAYLDDANTIPLDGYARLDGRLSYRYGSLSFTVDVLNIFDANYSTTGFPDPAGSDTIFFYPASGRRAQVGVSVTI